jgi:hypothetical protein
VGRLPKRRDLLRLLESLLTPLLLATSEDAETEGEAQARLAMAVYTVAND